jgi:hypothetical protein
MVMQPVPQKKYRLHDGTPATEYEAVLENVKYWEAKRQLAEDKIEEFRRRLVIAEGAP